MIRYHARWLVPITSDPIADGTLVVDEATGRIVFVGRRGDAPRGLDRDLGNSVLMPGLVNAHCHLELTVMRGFLEDLGFRQWILRLITARRAILTPDTYLDSARLGLEEGVRAGVTTYADTGDSGVVARAMREAGVRGVMYREVFGPDPSQCAEALRELQVRVEEHLVEATQLVGVGISPHAPYSVSDDLFRAAAAYAVDRGLPMAIHIAESEIETQLVVNGEGEFAAALRERGIIVNPRADSPIHLLDRLGVLKARPLLIHCVRVEPHDVATIAASSCAVAHCAVSNAKLGHGIAPLYEMLKMGIVVGLGTDSVASNNRMNILEEARVALLMQRARLGSARSVSASDVLALATLGGARALGLDAEIGSLEPGKAADLAAFPLDDSAPTHDPIAAAVFALAGQARLVAVAGIPLVVDGALSRHDPALSLRVQSTANKLREWSALATQGRQPTPST